VVRDRFWNRITTEDIERNAPAVSCENTRAYSENADDGTARTRLRKYAEENKQAGRDKRFVEEDNMEE
jgi:hypothetical protein